MYLGISVSGLDPTSSAAWSSRFTEIQNRKLAQDSPNISTGMAIAGVILFAKSIKLTTKFTSALDIPVEFIEKNVKLRGKLCHITEKGLEVEHVPISLPFLSSLQRKYTEDQAHRVELDLFQSCGGRFFSVCLNEEILRQGLGKTTRIEGLHHDSPLYWKLHKRLLQAELKALKKNKGIWKEESYFEKLRDHISNNKFVQKLKQFVNWLRIHI
ncbi:protein C3orf33 homolog isoform X6 [Mauremys reevesii]|uniref:protein C3orf33 homolog isoform X6 n=1 Tax=Mauremys reevesii TaxID=260615 RepID=UPI00193F4180|nr:protein C3orf33 homolog isoform X6 [Mauremys reevesii]